MVCDSVVFNWANAYTRYRTMSKWCLVDIISGAASGGILNKRGKYSNMYRYCTRSLTVTADCSSSSLQAKSAL